MTPASPGECQHKRVKLGYVDWHAWAEKNQRRGLKQKQCAKCKLWLYPEEL